MNANTTGWRIVADVSNGDSGCWRVIDFMLRDYPGKRWQEVRQEAVLMTHWLAQNNTNPALRIVEVTP